MMKSEAFNGSCYVLALFLCFLGWLRTQIKRMIRDICITILKCGPIPQHVAFIMDGNRRFATRRGLPSKAHGHFHGFTKFEQVLEWCLGLGIKTVTVYAFSIENFKRPKEEVDVLMSLAEEKLEALSLHSEMIHKNQVGVRVIGDFDMMPERVRRAACNAMYATRHYTKHIINVCFPYTSSAEIVAASNALLAAVQAGTLRDEDISASHITQLLCTRHHSLPDILVRTSGERRLSDFLTWQCTQRPAPMLAFIQALWPDFGMRHLALIMLRFQFRKVIPQMPTLNDVYKFGTASSEALSTSGGMVVEEEEPARWTDFLQAVEKERWDMITRWQTMEPALNSKFTPPSSPSSSKPTSVIMTNE